jgi:hypothetical protein
MLPEPVMAVVIQYKEADNLGGTTTKYKLVGLNHYQLSTSDKIYAKTHRVGVGIRRV